jgi:phosphopantetheinyl transferase (holo-ACP synthase)
MISAGNDIVSIAAINTVRTQQPAFYKKILSETEITQYNQAYSDIISFEVYVWLLWSIKESAYKYLQRLNPELIFSPTRFIVSNLWKPKQPLIESFGSSQLEAVGFDDERTWTGLITCGNNTLHSRSVLYPDVIHSIVNHENMFKNVYWGIKTINNTSPAIQSAVVRTFVLDKLNNLFSTKKLRVDKSKYGYPVIFDGQNQIQLPVSLSHHEHFVAYSFYNEGSFDKVS